MATRTEHQRKFGSCARRTKGMGKQDRRRFIGDCVKADTPTKREALNGLEKRFKRK